MRGAEWGNEFSALGLYIYICVPVCGEVKAVVRTLSFEANSRSPMLRHISTYLGLHIIDKPGSGSAAKATLPPQIESGL